MKMKEKREADHEVLVRSSRDVCRIAQSGMSSDMSEAGEGGRGTGPVFSEGVFQQKI